MTPMPSLRDPETLHPLLRPLWRRHVMEGRARGIVVITVFCWRSCLSQNRLFQIGRRGIPGEKIVTRAQGGESWHNVERNGEPASLAYDLAAMTKDGKRYLPDDAEEWQVLAAIGESLGLTCGARWRMRDLGHYQLDGRGTLALGDAMAGADPVLVA